MPALPFVWLLISNILTLKTGWFDAEMLTEEHIYYLSEGRST